MSLINAINVPQNRIIYALDLMSWTSNPRAAYAILKSKEEDYNMIHRYLDLNLEQQINDFITCTTFDGISYVATAKDKAIMPNMYIFRQNFVADEITACYPIGIFSHSFAPKQHLYSRTNITAASNPFPRYMQLN